MRKQTALGLLAVTVLIACGACGKGKTDTEPATGPVTEHKAVLADFQKFQTAYGSAIADPTKSAALLKTVATEPALSALTKEVQEKKTSFHATVQPEVSLLEGDQASVDSCWMKDGKVIGREMTLVHENGAWKVNGVNSAPSSPIKCG